MAACNRRLFFRRWRWLRPWEREGLELRGSDFIVLSDEEGFA